MALVLALTRSTVAAGATTFVITDSTGNYSSINVGGYGAPNPARNVLALVLRVKNKRYDGTASITDTLLTLASYDAEIVTQWTVTMNEDGWQQAKVYGLNLYDVATLLQVGELVWNASTNVIERITVRTGVGPYTYTKVSAVEADLENALYTTAYSTTLDTYAIPGLSDCANRAIKKYFDDKTDSEKTTAEIDQSKQDAEEIDLSMTAITYGFEHLYMSETQKQVEMLEETCTCFTDSCPDC